MSGKSRRAIDGARDRTERVHRGMAALVTGLLHALLLVALLRDPAITLATPRAEAGGSAMQVTLVDGMLPPSPPEPVPPIHKPVHPKRPKAPRAIKRPPATPVAEATIPMPAEEADQADTSNAASDTAPEPPDSAHKTADVARPAHVWGQPPGWKPDDNAIASAALAARLGSHRGRSEAPVGPDMGVDGFQVFYELANETRLRSWREQGMTELFLPMPGTRRRMVCPLEVALRRGSSACRMVDEDSPELRSIGDAREVINVRRVYQLGNMVWDGPGPYR